MSVDQRKDCRDCLWCVYVRGAYECAALTNRYPTSWMRDDRNECKREALLFKPKPPRMGEPYAAH